MPLIVCKNQIELLGGGFAHVTIGKVYEYIEEDPDDDEHCGYGGYIFDDIGNVHYLPPINEPRDPVDNWATSDYFEEV